MGFVTLGPGSDKSPGRYDFVVAGLIILATAVLAGFVVA